MVKFEIPWNRQQFGKVLANICDRLQREGRDEAAKRIGVERKQIASALGMSAGRLSRLQRGLDLQRDKGPEFIDLIERALGLFGANDAELGALRSIFNSFFLCQAESALGGVETMTQGHSPLVALQRDRSVELQETQSSYAVLSLRTENMHQKTLPGQVQFGFDLNCPADEYTVIRTKAKIRTALRRCRLKFDCGGGHTGDMKSRSGAGAGVKYNNAHITTYGTSDERPEWMITSLDNQGIGKVEDVPGNFVCIDGLRSGSLVTAEIHASIKEIRESFLIDAVTGRGESAAYARIRGRLLGAECIGGESHEGRLASSAMRMSAKPEDN